MLGWDALYDIIYDRVDSNLVLGIVALLTLINLGMSPAEYLS